MHQFHIENTDLVIVTTKERQIAQICGYCVYKKRPFRAFIEQVAHCRTGLQTGNHFEGLVVGKRTRSKPCERGGGHYTAFAKAHHR